MKNREDFDSLLLTSRTKEAIGLIDKITKEELEQENYIHLACRWGKEKIVQALIKKNVDVNQADEDGWTPLHSACYHGNAEIVEILLKKGANVNVKDKDGRTPLDLATRWSAGDESIAKLLREAGANEVNLYKAPIAFDNGNTQDLYDRKKVNKGVGDMMPLDSVTREPDNETEEFNQGARSSRESLDMHPRNPNRKSTRDLYDRKKVNKGEDGMMPLDSVTREPDNETEEFNQGARSSREMPLTHRWSSDGKKKVKNKYPEAEETSSSIYDFIKTIYNFIKGGIYSICSKLVEIFTPDSDSGNSGYDTPPTKCNEEKEDEPVLYPTEEKDVMGGLPLEPYSPDSDSDC